MKIAKALAAILVVASLSLAGCGKKDEGKKNPEPDQTAQQDEQPAAESDAAPKEEEPEEAEVVTAVDFEEEASEEITEKNLEAELKKLEDELAVNEE